MKAMAQAEEAMPEGAEAISSGAEPLPAVDAKLINCKDRRDSTAT